MIKFSILATTHAAKMAWIERALELLRLERSLMGEWYKKGLTLEQYQKLRAEVQIQFPYTSSNLSKDLWEDYLKGRYSMKTNVLYQTQAVLRESLFNSTRFSPNIDSDITK